MPPPRPPRRRSPRGALAAALLLALVVAWACVTRPSLRRPPPAAPLDPEPAAARLRGHVRALAETYAPRTYERPENLEAVADYVRRELDSAGLAARLEPFSAPGPGGETRPYANVVARVGGDPGAPAGAERLVVVGAHYDAARGTPGADDNASGVAALLELARELARRPPPRPVELVAYCLEEPPFFGTEHMGSRAHAARLARSRARVDAMLSLEMLGYYADAPGSQRLPAAALAPFYPSEGNFVAVVGRLEEGALAARVRDAMRAGSTLPAYSLNGPRATPGLDWSDHYNYWDAGFPALLVTDTSFYRNDRYHTERDTADSLDYGRLAEAVRGLAAAVLDLASGP